MEQELETVLLRATTDDIKYLVIYSTLLISALKLRGEAAHFFRDVYIRTRTYSEKRD